jgi:diguanylate cyclase (GGDEF)-like protein
MMPELNDHVEICRKILVVDDDPAVRRLLVGYLTAAGYEVAEAAGGKEAMHILLNEGPPMVITDWMMPEMSGLDLCRQIRNTEGIGLVYVIILTALTEKDRLVEAFDAGTDDYLTKPVSRQELLARLKAAMRVIELETRLLKWNRQIHKVNAEFAILNRKLERLATVDELTNLANRRHAMAFLERLWQQARRNHHPLSCVMLDIDHFKLVNDTYGHSMGDVVLSRIAQILDHNARAGDIAARTGGEEFLIICPQTDVHGAAAVAERIRRSVEESGIRSGNVEINVTLSAGVVDASENLKTPDDLLRAADEALYQAKRTGRNKVCIAEQCEHRPNASAKPATEEVSEHSM